MWFKVDDHLAIHPKVIQAGNAAMGLWVRAGAWSGGALSDGLVPDHMLQILGGTRREANKLVACGLWDKVPDGYQFHDWDKYQPTKSKVEEKREKDRLRKAARDAEDHGSRSYQG